VPGPWPDSQKSLLPEGRAEGRPDSGSNALLCESLPDDRAEAATGVVKRSAGAAQAKGEGGRRKPLRISTISAEFANEQDLKVWLEFLWPD